MFVLIIINFILIIIVIMSTIITNFLLLHLCRNLLKAVKAVVRWKLVLSFPLSHPCSRLARNKGDCEEKTEHFHTKKANERGTRGREEIPNKD